MGFMEKMIKQCRRPTGRLGKFLGRGMNFGHAGLRRWGLGHISIEPDAVILDVGCGGGKTVQEMARISSNRKVYGLDYSQDMVELSRKINKKFIREGRVEIKNGSVSSLPFPDGVFDLVTAFESYYFWPNLIDDLKEVKRVLKPAGTLLLANEAYKHENFEKRNSKLAKWLDMRIHTPDEFKNFLTEAGYIDIEVFTLPEKNRITAIAGKQ